MCKGTEIGRKKEHGIDGQQEAYIGEIICATSRWKVSPKRNLLRNVVALKYMTHPGKLEKQTERSRDS